MAYSSLRDTVLDLERRGDLRVVEHLVDPYLELGMIQRRAFQLGAPALLFTQVEGTRFPCLANLYGTQERARYVLRHGLRAVEALVGLKADPEILLRGALGLPRRLLSLLGGAAHALPVPIPSRKAPVRSLRLTLADLPQVVCWPRDGGPFITLPAVYSQSPGTNWWRGWTRSNLGMYRVQMAGNDYLPDEAGLHYQIHRGLGVHHQQALEAGVDLPVTITVGGAPALALSAVMPLPEGMPEVAFCGVLSGRGVRLCRGESNLPLFAEADFVIEGLIQGRRTKPEGPFGDHLGYYSLTHPFPLLKVTQVWARQDAIWPFTTVGRPPQEDSVIGELIHEMTGPALPTVLPGVKAVNAVDEAGVHPLLLAVASERYEPYRQRKRPQEILTAANAILGQGQLSLAKYLLIVAGEDAPDLHPKDSQALFQHLLERIDLRRDLHYQTQTSIDTLDYSGSGFQTGSKLVMAAVGSPVRALYGQDWWREHGVSSHGPFQQFRVVAPGILALAGPPFKEQVNRGEDPVLSRLDDIFPASHPARKFPFWVVTEDASLLESQWANFLWVTFTRSDPACDTYGFESRFEAKHWGCTDSLVIDARVKPHHAPALEEDPKLVLKLESLARRGGPLYGIF